MHAQSSSVTTTPTVRVRPTTATAAAVVRRPSSTLRCAFGWSREVRGGACAAGLKCTACYNRSSLWMVNVNTTDATTGATALLLPAQNTHTLHDPIRDPCIRKHNVNSPESCPRADSGSPNLDSTGVRREGGAHDRHAVTADGAGGIPSQSTRGAVSCLCLSPSLGVECSFSLLGRDGTGGSCESLSREDPRLLHAPAISCMYYL